MLRFKLTKFPKKMSPTMVGQPNSQGKPANEGSLNWVTYDFP